MDDAAFERMMSMAAEKIKAKKGLGGGEPLDVNAGFNQDPRGAINPNTGEPEPALGNPDQPIESFAGGMAKAAFETKDFLVGETPVEDRSPVRRSIEQGVQNNVAEAPIVDGLAAGIGQFAGAMIGLGKLSQGLRVLPWFGKMAAVGEGTKVGAAVMETGKAALAGSIAFDPWEDRLSNMIQDTALANPVSEWLAADPEDSAAEGRLKAALESIGLDATIMGTFILAGRAYKYAARGNEEGAKKAASKLEQQIKAQRDEFGMDFGPAPADGPAPQPVDPALGPAPDARTMVPGEQPPVGLDANGQPIKQPDTVPQPDEVTQPPIDPELQPEEVRVVDTVTQAKQDTVDPLLTQASRPRVRLADEDTMQVYENSVADANAYATHGGWTGTIETHHAFGRGEGIPYQKLANPEAPEFNNFMARVVDAAEEKLVGAGVGVRISDARLERMVAQRVGLTGEDPAQLMAMIQQSGERSVRLAAEMEAGYVMTMRSMMDSYALAERIRIGDFTEFGSKDAAVAALKQRLSVAASLYASSKQMSSAAGRTLRRMRTDFMLDPEYVGKLDAIDPDLLVKTLTATKGDVSKIKLIAQPGILEKMTDVVNFVLINNLVSGPTTHLINIVTNGYMVGARPLERIIGGAVQGLKGGDAGAGGWAMVREGAKQYGYTASAAYGGFRSAVQAFVRNDSIMAPHSTELYRTNQRLGQPSWKPFDGSVENLVHNAGQMAIAAIGVPTRVLGATDEIVKQTVYRSKVAAAEHVAAAEAGVQLGLTGDNLKAYITQRVGKALNEAFDDAGRAVNPKALEEAQIATFQQKLNKGTIGASTQNFVAAHPTLRLVLPFVRTPTNVIRYGWKMTPGLNMLQTEYRQMLKGDMGSQAQAQAYGQMALGTLWMTSAASIMASDKFTITGGGPIEYDKRRDATEAGYQPYSIGFKAKDGTTKWLRYGRFDPIAIPLGIMADIQDVIRVEGPESKNAAEMSVALGLGLARQFTDKSYLTSMDQFLDMLLNDNAEGDKLTRFFGTMAGNFVPYSAALRNLNPDPHLKEARTVADRIMSGIPGLSDQVPNRYDLWGDPVLARRGVLATTTDDIVDTEIQRMVLEVGSDMGRASPNREGLDLRDITMEDGRNAYEVYQQRTKDLDGRTGTSMKEAAAALMQSPQWAALPDGKSSERGTRQWLLSQRVVRPYREAAWRSMLRDANIRAALGERPKAIRQEYYDNMERIDQQGSVQQPPRTASDLVRRLVLD